MCERCDSMEVELQGAIVQLQGAERDIRAWRQRCAKLEADHEVEARNHPRWNEVAEKFDDWRRHCHHPRCQFNAERFWLAIPYYEQDGPELVEQAILGAAYDAFTTNRRNGSVKRYDSWELIFRNREKFEEFVNRAPRNGDRPG